MSESKCKFCGYRKRHASAFVAGKEFPGWTCGTQTILSGEIVQSTECSLRSELARLQAALEEAEAKVRRIDAEDTADAKVLLAAFNRETVLKSQLTAAAERAERAEKERDGLRDGLTQLKADIHCPIDLYERNGPQWTSPSGHEYEDTSYVLAKMEELEASVDALLHPTQEPSDAPGQELFDKYVHKPKEPTP